jgi:hypothetical protein
MSPCLVLYGLAAVAGLALGGPAARAATVLLVVAVLARHLVARGQRRARPVLLSPASRQLAAAGPTGG